MAACYSIWYLQGRYKLIFLRSMNPRLSFPLPLNQTPKGFPQNLVRQSLVLFCNLKPCCARAQGRPMKEGAEAGGRPESGSNSEEDEEDEFEDAKTDLDYEDFTVSAPPQHRWEEEG